MNPSIFKTYDIRGIVPDELDEEAVKKIAVAFVECLKPKNVVLGYDARISSPAFALVAKEAFLSMGVDVYDLGMIPIEVLYFACGHLKSDSGMMITASHNPREYNGIKIIGKDATPIGLGSGLEKIRDNISDNQNQLKMDKPKGKLIPTDIWDDYLKKIFCFIDIEDIKPIKIICDASNGVGGIALKKIAKKLPIEIIEMNFEPDGDFPNHEPNPLIAINRDQIVEECKKHDDLAFAAIFDGDADRIAFLDENGEFIDTDYISAFLTKILIDKNTGESIVFDMRRGWSVKEQAESLGSKYYASKSGYPYIRETMKKVNAIYGGEASAHNIYRDFYYSDSSMITLLLIAGYLSMAKETLSEAIREYRQSNYMYEETNFIVKDVEEIFSALEKAFPDGKKNSLDGLSIDYPDWHFNLRTSATQPLVRLNLEGKDPELIEEKRDMIIKIIEENGGTISEE